MTLIYRMIIVIILLLTLWNIFDDEDVKNQANTALVLIPLMLRALMIK